MRNQLATLLAAVASMIFAGAEARAADIYVLTNNSANNAANTNFGRIDSTTGAYTSITSLSGDVWNLANAPNGDFFATVGSSTSSALHTLTTTGTLSSSLGTIGVTVYGMAYRSTDATLYAFDSTNTDTISINPANGTRTTSNSSPGVLIALPNNGGRYGFMNDTIYFAGNFGATSPFGTMGFSNSSTFQQIAAAPVYAGMVLAGDGTTMYGIYGSGAPGQQRIYTIDVATGATTAGAFITGAGLGTYFHGAAIVPVPEPSTYALGTIASGLMAYLSRRRKARAVRCH